MRFRLLLFATLCACKGKQAAPLPLPAIDTSKSLFYNDSALLDDATFISFAKLMATVAPDNQGGPLLYAWFNRFATTEASTRAAPAQWMANISAAQGDDPSTWDLSQIPFKVTGIHNRIDLADFRKQTNCGVVRISLSSTDPVFQPFHLLFIFNQPISAGDKDGDTLTCQATAERWANLSQLSGGDWDSARRALLQSIITRQNWALIESEEFTVAPWEWRQWIAVADPSGALPFVLDNQPLFQTVAADALNEDGALRGDFLNFVAANAATLDARTVLIPAQYSLQVAHVTQGVPRTPLSLSGLAGDIAYQFPELRQNIEIDGCPVCHTADANFTQTLTDRTISPFYTKELPARAAFLQQLCIGNHTPAPYGPLQKNPVLPP